MFCVYGERLEGYQLSIYNRWGEKVFWSEDPEEAWTAGVKEVIITTRRHVLHFKV